MTLIRFFFLPGVLLCLGGAFAEEPTVDLTTPDHGLWKGQAPGTWVLTKSETRYNDPSKESRLYYEKNQLIGQDDQGQVWYLTGQSSEDGVFSYNPLPGRESSESAKEKILRSHSEERLLSGTHIPVEIQEFETRVDETGMKYSRARTVLKEAPHVVLESRVEESDQYQGETYHRIRTREVVKVESLTLFGKTIRGFRLQEKVDGRHGRILVVSPDIPALEVLIESASVKANPIDRYTYSKEVIAMGGDTENLDEYRRKIADQINQNRDRERILLDSETGKANLELYLSMGYAERQAADYLEAVLPKRSYFLSRSEMAAKVRALWSEYQENPTDQVRDRLKNAMKWGAYGSRSFTEPASEEVLLEIANSQDPFLSLHALAHLCRLTPFRYSDRLEQALIDSQRADLDALEILAQSPYGNPRRVLEVLDIPVDDLPSRLITFIPDDKSIEFLLTQPQESNRIDHLEILELLSNYDDDRVRDYISDLADSVQPQTSFMEYMNLPLAVSNLRARGASEFILKMLAETPDSSTPSINPRLEAFRTRMKKKGINLSDEELREMAHGMLQEEEGPLADEMQQGKRLVLARAALELQDPELLATVKRTFQSNEQEHLLYYCSFGKPDYSISYLGEDIQPGYNLEVTPEKLEGILSKPFYIFGKQFIPKEDESDSAIFYRYLGLNPNERNRQALIRTCFSNYSPDLDFLYLWQIDQKSWYRERIGASDFRPAIRGDNLRLLCETLPAFGSKGVETLWHLYQYPPFRPEVLVGLRRVKENRDGILKKLKTLDPVSEQESFELGFTLWCFGDQSQRDNYEYFPVAHDHGGIVSPSDIKDEIRFLPTEELIYLAEQRDRKYYDRRIRTCLAHALSYHPSQETARLLLQIWNEEPDRRFNSTYGKMFNRMAGRNFGLRKHEIENWIESLN